MLELEKTCLWISDLKQNANILTDMSPKCYFIGKGEKCERQKGRNEVEKERKIEGNTGKAR